MVGKVGANRKEVAAYAGLTPSPFASGERHREQGISKAENPLLRKAMVELTWLWLRYQPGSALARWFSERAGTARERVHKIAAVALARKPSFATARLICGIRSPGRRGRRRSGSLPIGSAQRFWRTGPRYWRRLAAAATAAA
jgi:transposase